jgi:hypothetical protein
MWIVSLPAVSPRLRHVALALSGSATHVLTFDLRMRAAALQAGLNSIDLGA